MKKILLLGNMNNNFFSVFRYLREKKNYNLTLASFDYEPSHFNFSNDSDKEYKFDDNNKYIKLSWGSIKSFYSKNPKKIKSFLSEYDIIIGCGTSPAFVNRAGLALGIFIPYGSDIYMLPFYNEQPSFFKKIAFYSFSKYQSKGIQGSSSIIFDYTNQHFEDMIKSLNINSKRKFETFPFLYLPEIENIANHQDKENNTIKKIIQLREENEFLIVQSSRQSWKTNKDIWEQKANNKLIEGFAFFLKDYPNLKAKLILFEYGIDVLASKELISQLGIKEKVEWVPLQPRNIVLQIVNVCDLLVGELHLSFFTYGTIIEAMSLGKTIMHFRNDNEYIKQGKKLYPMLNANSVREVTNNLSNFVKNKNEFLKLGKESKQWVNEYVVNIPLQHIKNVIN